MLIPLLMAARLSVQIQASLVILQQIVVFLLVQRHQILMPKMEYVHHYALITIMQTIKIIAFVLLYVQKVQLLFTVIRIFDVLRLHNVD